MEQKVGPACQAAGDVIGGEGDRQHARGVHAEAAGVDGGGVGGVGGEPAPLGPLPQLSPEGLLCRGL